MYLEEHLPEQYFPRLDRKGISLPHRQTLVLIVLLWSVLSLALVAKKSIVFFGGARLTKNLSSS